MNIRTMVISASAVVAIIVYLRWRTRINAGLAIAGKWFVGFLFDYKTCKTAETFCNEVAVLWFVFPLLDSLYEHKSITDPFLRHAFLIAGLFFCFAVMLSHAAGGE